MHDLTYAIKSRLFLLYTQTASSAGDLLSPAINCFAIFFTDVAYEFYSEFFSKF